jgi:hypothetical protein
MRSVHRARCSTRRPKRCAFTLPTSRLPSPSASIVEPMTDDPTINSKTPAASSCELLTSPSVPHSSPPNLSLSRSAYFLLYINTSSGRSRNGFSQSHFSLLNKPEPVKAKGTTNVVTTKNYNPSGMLPQLFIALIPALSPLGVHSVPHHLASRAPPRLSNAL